MPFPVDMQWIREAEEKLQAKLPQSYVDFMCRSNGGEVETAVCAWDLYPVWDKSNRKTLARTCNDIVRETEQAKNWTGFPSDAIAIAANGYGDQLILMPNDQTVYAWDHETGEMVAQADDFAKIISS